MSYSREVKAIFELTLKIIAENASFDPNLLNKLRELYDTGKWQDKTALSDAIDQLIAQKGR